MRKSVVGHIVRLNNERLATILVSKAKVDSFPIREGERIASQNFVAKVIVKCREWVEGLVLGSSKELKPNGIDIELLECAAFAFVRDANRKIAQAIGVGDKRQSEEVVVTINAVTNLVFNCDVTAILPRSLTIE